MIPLDRLTNYFQDAPVFVIGGGPSLKPYIQNETITNFLKTQVTLGCNRMFEWFSPTMAVIMDAWFFANYKAQIAQLPCPFFIPDHVKDILPNMYKVRKFRSTTDHIPTSFAQGVSVSNNCGVYATRIAYLLTRGPIFLLGMDLTHHPKDTHWHSTYSDPKRNSTSHRYQQFVRVFLETVQKMRAAERIIVSCSPASPLNAHIPYKSLDDVHHFFTVTVPSSDSSGVVL